jgi:hypothetical protein
MPTPFKAISRDERMARTAYGVDLVFVEYMYEGGTAGYARPDGWATHCSGCAMRSETEPCTSRRTHKCGDNRTDRGFGYWKLA